jgi:hypothetical protein
MAFTPENFRYGPCIPEGTVDRKDLQPQIAEKLIQALLIRPSTNAIMARTSRTWIRPAALYTKTPRSQPMIRMTAII